MTLVIASCKTYHESFVCGMASGIVVDPKFDLDNFDGFIDIENNKPFSTIHLDRQRIYSPDYKFYFEYQANKDKALSKAILYDTNRKPISTVKNLIIGEMPIWLEKCVIINGGSKSITEKIIINLTTGRVKTYSKNCRLKFLCQTNNKAFFEFRAFNNKISGKSLKKSHSIISLNENGRCDLVHYNKLSNPDPESVYIYEFFNSKFTKRCLKPEYKSKDSQPTRIEYIMDNKVVRTNENITFYESYEKSFFLNGDTYIILNKREIYRVNKNSFEKIFDFGEAKINFWIRDFKIEGQYLIFKTQNGSFGSPIMDPPNDSFETVNGLMAKYENYGYNTIGIVNLITKEYFFPLIK